MLTNVENPYIIKDITMDKCITKPKFLTQLQYLIFKWTGWHLRIICKQRSKYSNRFINNTIVCICLYFIMNCNINFIFYRKYNPMHCLEHIQSFDQSINLMLWAKGAIWNHIWKLISAAKNYPITLQKYSRLIKIRTLSVFLHIYRNQKRCTRNGIIKFFFAVACF